MSEPTAWECYVLFKQLDPEEQAIIIAVIKAFLKERVLPKHPQ